MSRHARVVILILLAVLLSLTWAQTSEPRYAVGYVFHDRNGNGERDPGEEGLTGVRVSNGRDIVKTDADGRYRIRVDDHTVIFVIRPSGWMTPVCENNLPRFYYIHKPHGSPPLRYRGVAPTGPLPESIDFPLHATDEPERFKVVVFGDTQPATTRQVAFLSRDIIQELIGTEAVFGVTLGDIVNVGRLALFGEMAAAVGTIGIPWYNVQGNHDADRDAAPAHRFSSETFTNVFGPPYYSFDYGPVHFVVLNNNYFGHVSGYSGRLDIRQMSWLRRNLALVPDDRLVVLMMHIPLHRMRDRREILGLLESRPNTFSLSAHFHTNEHHFLGADHGWHGDQPHHHLVHVAACGGWWAGMPDELGIPHSLVMDGTPNGYSIITFDVTSYSVRYKAARRPADYQMNIFAPDEIPAADSANTEVLVNVFAGSERSIVEMSIGGGDWIAMERTRIEDPAYVRQREFEMALDENPWKVMRREPVPSTHIWRANLPPDLSPGAHLIVIRTTDMFGQTHEGRRVLHIR